MGIKIYAYFHAFIINLNDWRFFCPLSTGLQGLEGIDNGFHIVDNGVEISKVQPVVMNNYKSVTGLERRHIVEKQQVHAIRCLLNTEKLQWEIMC